MTQRIILEGSFEELSRKPKLAVKTKIKKTIKIFKWKRAHKQLKNS